MQRVEQDRSRALARARGGGPNFGMSEATSSDPGDMDMEEDDDEEIDDEVSTLFFCVIVKLIILHADAETNYDIQ